MTATGRDLTRDRNWRLVCHACGFKYPPNAAQVPDCCADPDLRIHNIDKPCSMCEEPTKKEE